jgi:muramoyltetrapeptide carboxypeptidase
MTLQEKLKGKPLPPGGTVGVPAPAFAFHNRSEILRGVEWWEQRGYKVRLAEGVYERKGYVAGDPKTRANGITAMFADPEVDLVMCSDAGFGSAHTIPYIDFDVIRDNPKPFVGYSDITSLHTSIRHYTGLVTFVGPLLSDIAHKETKPFTQERFLRAVTSDEPLGDMPRNPEDGYIRCFNSGSVGRWLVAACGCWRRTSERRGRSISTERCSSSRTSTRPRGTSTGSSLR